MWTPGAAAGLGAGIEPDNVFLVSDAAVAFGERTKVLDFGIAKMGGADGHRTSHDAIMGTPPYMSPEQCRGAGHVGPESDVYSLGIMLYEMLCGRRPFSGEDAVSFMAAHLTQPPPLLRELAPEVPAAVAELVQEMLRKGAAERPGMTLVEQRLGKLAEGAPATTTMTAVAPPKAAPTGVASAGESAAALFRSQEPSYIFRDGYEPAAENIDRLLVFIPIFEDRSRRFYEVDTGGAGGAGAVQGGYRFGPEVTRLVQVAVEQGLICESRAVAWLSAKASLYRSGEAIDGADLYACQRLLTAFVDDDPQLAINLREAIDRGLLLRLLYRLRGLRDEMQKGQRRIREEGRVQLVRGELHHLGVDAVACFTDEKLSGSGRVEQKLRERGGPELVAACQRLIRCPVGEARLVDGHRLPAGAVLLSAVPAWRGGQQGEEEKLWRCYESCCKLAADKGFHTLAFAGLGGDTPGIPPEVGVRIAVDSVRRYLAENRGGALWKVYFALADDLQWKQHEAALSAPPSAPPAQAPPPSADSGLPRSPEPSPVAVSEEKPKGTPPTAAVVLPNPEARPIGSVLKHELLINCLYSQVTLEAFRFSRTLINDQAADLMALDRLIDGWLVAHDAGPPAELAQLSRWADGKFEGPAPLQDLCDRMAVLAHGALGWQQPSCLYGFRVFLRAVRDSFVLQSRLFGLSSKLGRDASLGRGAPGTPHKPRARELPDAWAAVYAGSILESRAARTQSQELTSFPAAAEVRPLAVADSALHLGIIRNLSVGATTLAGAVDDYFLVVGFHSPLDRYYHLRVPTGTSEMVPRDRWRGGHLPLDYVLCLDSERCPDTNRYDLSPAKPEGE